MASCTDPEDLANILEAAKILDLEKKAQSAETAAMAAEAASAAAMASKASDTAFYQAAQVAEDKEEELKAAISAVSRDTAASATVVAKALKSHLELKETNRVSTLLKAAQMVDLVFVLDATGSMWRVTDAVKKKIREIIGEVQEIAAHLKFRIGMVAYRDVCDEGTAHGRFNVHPLSGSISACENFLDALKVEGGGDACEDVIGGLQKALEMQWSYHTKLIILCGDAPCHGTEYYDAKYRGRGWDEYPSGKFPGSTPLAPIMRELKTKGVDMTFLKLNNTTNVMIDQMNQMTGGGEFVAQVDLKIGIEEGSESPAAAIAEAIKSSTKDSLMRSLSASSSAATTASAKGSVRCPKVMSSILEAVAEDEAPPPLPHGWEAVTDSNGKEYYWNKLTNKTVWERPK